MDEINDLVKAVVEELAKEPFKYEFNVASFGSLKHGALLRILEAVLSEIDPQYKDEMIADFSDQTTKKILDLLRILRYWPQNNDEESIREGLEGRLPEIIWEILGWLLPKRDELKQRAYLAQYLVKITIPDEIMMDDDVNKCIEEYENKMELFKETHKKLQSMKLQMEKRSVGELVNDLGRIDHDVECLSRKVDNLKIRIGDVPGKDKYLEQAKKIRIARESKLSMLKQISDEEMKLSNVNKNLEMLKSRLVDFSDLNKNGTQEGALERLEQHKDILKIIVEERLPQQIQVASRQYLAMQIIEGNPLICRTDLEFHIQRLSQVKKEIIVLENQISLKNQDPSLKYLRQQVYKNQQMKLELAEEVENMNRDASAIQEILEDKRSQNMIKFGCEDGWVLRPQGHRDYVKHIRTKGGKYKIMRAELQSLQAEVGNLSTTKFILIGELNDSEDNLKIVEEKLGIIGFTCVQNHLENLSSEKSSAEQKKMESIQRMASLAKDLNDKVLERKYELEPVIAEVSAGRKMLQELTLKANNANSIMEQEMAPITSSIEKLEKHIGKLLDSYEKDQLKFVKMEAEIPVLKTNLLRAAGVGGVGPFARTNRDRVLAKIVESERIHQSLKEEVGQIEETQEYERNQQKMWSDLTRMFEVKVEHLKDDQSAEMDSGQSNYDSWEVNPID